MPEVADAGEDNFIGMLDIFRASDPLNLVAAFLNRVDEAADVAGDVVEEVDCGHCEGFGACDLICKYWITLILSNQGLSIMIQAFFLRLSTDPFI